MDADARIFDYARIARGEHPGWEGDAVANRDAYAFRIGANDADAGELVRCLGIHEAEVSDATGLSPGSLRRMSAAIKRGMRLAEG